MVSVWDFKKHRLKCAWGPEAGRGGVNPSPREGTHPSFGLFFRWRSPSPKVSLGLPSAGGLLQGFHWVYAGRGFGPWDFPGFSGILRDYPGSQTETTLKFKNCCLKCGVGPWVFPGLSGIIRPDEIWFRSGISKSIAGPKRVGEG